MRGTPRILMCPPDHYGIEYEINPWMDKRRATVKEETRKQWDALVAILRGLGATIELMQPLAGLPDMVFTANAGIIFRDLFVTSRFRHPQRQAESPYFEEWFAKNGFRVAGLATPKAFEGAGDALFCGETLFVGYLHRSEIEAHQWLGRLLGREALVLELVDPRFYHLDTCFCPLAPDAALYYPGAFDDYGRRVLTDRVPHLLAVDEDDAIRFGCNAVVIGRDVVLNQGCDKLNRQLLELGWRAHPTDLSEFLKAGGAAKCLTLRLDGEEAAIFT